MSLLLILIIVALYYWISKKQYEKTDYYKQTHNSFHKSRYDKGTKGEFLTWKYLQKLSGYKKYLFNCYLPKDNGETTEIDVILLHESGIYVFESKNYSGWIFGTETQQYWTQTLPKGRGKSQKEHFFNPIIQNKVHLKWLSKYLGIEIDQFYSYIIFSDRCTLKDITLTSGQHHVINRYDILPAVSSNAKTNGIKLTQEEIDDLYSKLQPLTQVDGSLKLAHIENIQNKKKPQKENENEIEPQKESNESTQDQMICPRCGSKLVLRTAAKGNHAGEQFWGCSRYPQCKYIKSIDK
ncbi:MAG: NERD domain-containing protein [Lachnospiraceae bacterium]|nr:NERD domain-containing protein [Lachnospiraceae bacterium]